MIGRFLSLVYVLSIPALVCAAEVGSYSMTQVSSSPGGGQKAVTKWFVTPENSRTEMVPDAKHAVGSVVVITRRDKGLAWTLFPAKRAYIERTLKEGELRRLGERYKSNLRVDDLGKEQVLGHDCSKQRVQGTVKFGAREVKSVQTVWQCDGFDIPLRIEGEDGSQTWTTALEVGPVPDRLFKVPSGYRKAKDLKDILRDPGRR